MSGRARRSAVSPKNLTSPFSMKIAFSARVRATLTDCSTTITVVPRAWIWRTMSSSWPTTAGARPRESSSIISNRGLARKAWASDSICCSPPDSDAAAANDHLPADVRYVDTTAAEQLPPPRRVGRPPLGVGHRGGQGIAAVELEERRRREVDQRPRHGERDAEQDRRAVAVLDPQRPGHRHEEDQARDAGQAEHLDALRPHHGRH